MKRILTVLCAFLINFAIAQTTHQDRSPYEVFETDAIYLMFMPGHGIGNVDVSNRNIDVLDVYPELQELMINQSVYEVKQAFKILSKRNEKLARVYTLKINFGLDLDALLKSLSELNYVQLVERIPLYTYSLEPNDPDYANANKNWHLDRIGAEGAWDISQGCESVKIAIVDDAVMINHEDLQANIFINTAEIPNNGIDDDNNGYVDDVNGYDVADNDPNPGPPATASENYFSHGTHVAGIAAGVTNNGLGTASLGFNSSIIPVKTKSNNSQYPSSLTNPMQGVEYAIAAGADIINMSWGSYSWSYVNHLVFEEADQQGIVCIAAAGNDALPFTSFPAGYSTVISVVATDFDDDIASFSNFSQEQHIYAPGVNIWSALATGTSDYGYKSGTSMSTPLVSALIALMICENPNFEVPGIRQCIASSADYILSEHIDNFYIPRIDAMQTMLCNPPIINDCSPMACEMIHNGNFESPIFSNVDTYDSFGAVHAGQVCSWDNYIATADVFPLDVSAPNHAAHLQSNIQEYEGELFEVSEGLVTDYELDFVPGNTYKLEFDYSVTKEAAFVETEFLEAIEIILVYNDWFQQPGSGVVTDDYIVLGSIPYPTVDFTHGSWGSWINNVVLPTEEQSHHFVLEFVAPADSDIRKLLIHPLCAYDNLGWNSTMGLFLDNISLVPVVEVEGISSNYQAFPDDCITLSANTPAGAVFWEPEQYFEDPTLMVQEICLSEIETCAGGSIEFTVTSMDVNIGCTSSDTVLVNIKGSDEIPPAPNVPNLMELNVCQSLDYTTAPTAWDNCDGAVVGQPNPAFPITESTTITWTFTDSYDNVSTQNQEVIVLSIDTEIALSQGSLIASQDGATYQWIDCETGLEIEGATEQIFTPEANGLYSVQISYGECVVTTPCYDFVTLGVIEDELSQNLSVLPNPTSGEMSIQYSAGQIFSIEILDLAGKSLMKMDKLNIAEAFIDLSKFTSGVYLMRVETGEGIVTRRIVKNN